MQNNVRRIECKGNILFEDVRSFEIKIYFIRIYYYIEEK